MSGDFVVPSVCTPATRQPPSNACGRVSLGTRLLSVVKAGYSARYRICTGYAQLAQISKRCSTCIHVAAV